MDELADDTISVFNGLTRGEIYVAKVLTQAGEVVKAPVIHFCSVEA